MSAIFGPGITYLLAIMLFCIVAIWLLTIFWAVKDAKARGYNSKIAFIISLIPFIGVLAYVLIRPPLFKIDQEEQNLDIALKRIELTKYSKCPDCKKRVNFDFINCPHCGRKLKNTCSKCGKPLNPAWKLCPYCGTGVSNFNEQEISKSFSDPQQNQKTTRTPRKRDFNKIIDAKNDLLSKFDRKPKVEDTYVDTTFESAPKHVANKTQDLDNKDSEIDVKEKNVSDEKNIDDIKKQTKETESKKATEASKKRASVDPSKKNNKISATEKESKSQDKEKTADTNKSDEKSKTADQNTKEADKTSTSNIKS